MPQPVGHAIKIDRTELHVGPGSLVQILSILGEIAVANQFRAPLVSLFRCRGFNGTRQGFEGLQFFRVFISTTIVQFLFQPLDAGEKIVSMYLVCRIGNRCRFHIHLLR